MALQYRYLQKIRLGDEGDATSVVEHVKSTKTTTNLKPTTPRRKPESATSNRNTPSSATPSRKEVKFADSTSTTATLQTPTRKNSSSPSTTSKRQQQQSQPANSGSGAGVGDIDAFWSALESSANGLSGNQQKREATSSNSVKINDEHKEIFFNLHGQRVGPRERLLSSTFSSSLTSASPLVPSALKKSNNNNNNNNNNVSGISADNFYTQKFHMASLEPEKIRAKTPPSRKHGNSAELATELYLARASSQQQQHQDQLDRKNQNKISRSLTPNPKKSVAKKSSKHGNDAEEHNSVIVTRPLEVVVVGDRAAFTLSTSPSANYGKKLAPLAGSNKNTKENHFEIENNNQAPSHSSAPAPISGGVWVVDRNENFLRRSLPISAVINRQDEEDAMMNGPRQRASTTQQQSHQHQHNNHPDNNNNASNSNNLSARDRVRQDEIQKQINHLADGEKKASSSFRSKSPRFATSNFTRGASMYDRLSYVRPSTCQSEDFYVPKGMGDAPQNNNNNNNTNSNEKSSFENGKAKKSANKSSSSFRSLVPRFSPALSHGTGMVAPKLH